MKIFNTNIKSIMKSSLNASLLSGVVLGVFGILSSCEKALDVEADGTISGDIYADQESIEQALVGAYYSLGGIYDGIDGGELFGGDFMLIPTLIVAQNASEVSWDGTNAPLYDDFVDNTILNTNQRIESNWRRAYEVINIVNNIIKNIDNVTTDQDKIHGEALAIRGMLYFELVRFWGKEYEDLTKTETSIPLLTEPIVFVEEIKTPTLATVEAVYTRVVSDLTTASTLLQSLGKNDVNVSYYVCQTYLMRASMHMGDYASAKAYADTIINSGTYSLSATPTEAFNNFSNSSEDIFAIQQTLSNNTGDITTGTGPTNYYSSLSGKGIGALRLQTAPFLGPTTLQNRPEFASNDLRGVRDMTTDDTSTPESIVGAFYRHITSTATYCSSKFMSSDRVIPVIRLAEIYLARAEAELMATSSVSTAIVDDLNATRSRAGLDSLSADAFPSTAELLDSIKTEKKREFIYEGLIFHDLKRWNDEIGNSTPETFGQDDKFVFPIPQSETDTWN
ncbi:RagB/SusD family nutrient uptake outer membrane protein [Marinoscillum sp. MHG1-6]|uniref:RagB/SusD family nutrient uptake outer membrane protein n=1 Tax=Marinoscillum sp. MHG1-6 TaxID=2959627 RepID=UPI002157922D|nr:RagB/SusD family nutrient uptake outer membrane protein [Marinoscillum sp. MHG1-6]